MASVIMKLRFIVICMLGVLFFMHSCEEPFTPVLDERDVSPTLIVDGYIDVDGPSKFRIFYSRPINPTGNGEPVAPGRLGTSVQVSVVSEDGQEYFGTASQTHQVYSVDHPVLDMGTAYFLRLIVDGKVYESVPSKGLESGEIEAVDFTVDEEGVEIQVSSLDPSHASPYYRWEFEEAWKFSSAVKPNAIIEGGQLVPMTPETDYGTCYQFSNSNNILIGSSGDLSENRIYKAPIQSIAPDSEKLEIRYSILVKQFALSEGAYAFWDLIRKNSEQIGDIFGVMPSEVSGNIANIADPSEKVIGYIEVVRPSEKRIFIDNRAVPPVWRPDRPFYRNCMVVDTVTVAEAPGVFREFPGYLPGWFIYANPASPDPTHVNYAPARCVDCRFKGQQAKPEFWID